MRSPAPLLVARATELTTQPLVLHVSEERGEHELVRRMQLGTQSVFFRLRGDALPPPLSTWDFAPLAYIYTAMRLRRPLHVAGPVSRSLLGNLEEFQRAWHRWLPKQYAVVPLSADEEVEAPARPLGSTGVFAFSGGLDSTFSLVLHATGAAGRASVSPAVATMVHGFDIRLEDRAGFARASNSAREALTTLGVPLVTIETNWRSELCHNWRMEHMAGIAAALNQFQGTADTAIVSSDEGYDKIDIPWGSNLLTNPLLGGDLMRLKTEGAGLTRTERLAFILERSAMAPSLRVCWEAAATGVNCGVCEKCISTQLNFRALGREPEGFSRTAGLLRIAALPVRSKGDLYFLRETQRAAGQLRVRGLWRVAARVAIARHVLLRPWLILKDAVKSRVRLHPPLFRQLKRLVRNHA